MPDVTSAFLRSVMHTVDRHHMDISTPLVMVSGGPDSVALLRSLIALGANPSVLHLDHGLRGDESAGDARFVEELCGRLGVPFTVRRLELDPGAGLQERARDERYRIADDLADIASSSAVALGHNADDVSETVLMNLARGAGTQGLGSIPPVRGRYVRPLIDRSRKEILAYLGDIGQDYRTDPTNLTGKYTRNRLRNEVLPLLDEMYPGASGNIRRSAGLARDDLHALGAVVQEATEERGDETVIRLEALPGDEAARRTLLGHAVRSAFRRMKPKSDMPDSRTIWAILESSFKVNGSRIFHLPDGIVAVARGGHEVAVYEYRDLSKEDEIPLSMGETEFGGWRVKVGKASHLDREDAARREVAYLAGGEDCGGYRVRFAREKDTIRPIGLGGTKTVLRAMMDRKVPRDIRRLTPVVMDGLGRVAWIFLGESGTEHAVGSDDEEMIRLEVEKI